MIDSVTVESPVSVSLIGSYNFTSYLFLNRARETISVMGAIDQRVSITLAWNGTDETMIQFQEGDSVPTSWTGGEDDYDYSGKYGILFAALSYYSLTGVSIAVRLPFSIDSGFGQHESLCACITHACLALKGQLLGTTAKSKQNFDLMNSIDPDASIMHLASTFHGGIMSFEWNVPAFSPHPVRLIARDGFNDLEERIVLALLPERPAGDKGRGNLRRGYLKASAMRELRALNQLSKDSVIALRVGNWLPFGDYMRNEQSILNEIDPERKVGFAQFEHSPSVGSGSFNILDYGQAGCWFFSDDPADAVNVKDEWEIRGAQIVDVKFSDTGLQ